MLQIYKSFVELDFCLNNHQQRNKNHEDLRQIIVPNVAQNSKLFICLTFDNFQTSTYFWRIKEDNLTQCEYFALMMHNKSQAGEKVLKSQGEYLIRITKKIFHVSQFWTTWTTFAVNDRLLSRFWSVCTT